MKDFDRIIRSLQLQFQPDIEAIKDPLICPLILQAKDALKVRYDAGDVIYILPEH